MKKLVTITFAALAAVTVNAATANWKVTGGNIYDSTGSSTKFTGTAYVIDATTTMSALYDAFASGSLNLATTAAASISVSAGAVVTTSGANAFSYGEAGSNYSFYLAIVDDDNIYMSNLLSDKAALNPPTQQGLSFGSQQNGTATFSNVAAATGFQGAGHWSSSGGGGEPVPEPTSGLLMLLGMAGLALKRKRA